MLVAPIPAASFTAIRSDPLRRALGNKPYRHFLNRQMQKLMSIPSSSPSSKTLGRIVDTRTKKMDNASQSEKGVHRPQPA